MLSILLIWRLIIHNPLWINFTLHTYNTRTNYSDTSSMSNTASRVCVRLGVYLYKFFISKRSQIRQIEQILWSWLWGCLSVASVIVHECSHVTLIHLLLTPHNFHMVWDIFNVIRYDTNLDYCESIPREIFEKVRTNIYSIISQI